MGLLSKGTPMKWEQAKQYSDHVRKHGIRQLLHIYEKGDELEYMLVYKDKDRVKLSLRAATVLEQLQKEEEALGKDAQTSWKPEYARYMLEATPGKPYGALLHDLLQVESNMLLRRSQVEKLLKENELLLSLTGFPDLGVYGCFEPHYDPKGIHSHSMFIPDEAIAPHARFPTLTENIRTRRGSKVAINVPIFHDEKTPKPFIESFSEPPFPEDGYQQALPDHIYLDCMCFGMGCSCLQITFQACNIDEARMLYDQLAVLSPIMLALTAACPIFKGYLSDVDCRWDIIAKSVDDRTEEERGLKPLEKNRFKIPKSRYDSINSYLSTQAPFKQKYNDIDLVLDKEILKELLEGGVDEQLARHYAHLFIRDPLVIFRELLEQDDANSSDHFENIQSTNWQTMRFKPPPPNSNIGWRVEFRSMEIQLTEFENAAFSIFIVLLTRTILSLGLNFYIPISKVDENMKKAQKRDAVLNEKFYFRTQILDHMPADSPSLEIQNILSQYGSPLPDSSPLSQQLFRKHHHVPDPDGYQLMTIDEIMNGKKEDGAFPGLIPLIESYLSSMNVDMETRFQLDRYLNLLKKRASGEYMTTAHWIRQFVQQHPKYQKDSRVTPEMTRDLILRIEQIVKGEWRPKEMFGLDWKSLSSLQLSSSPNLSC